jgi:hypothetical protein
MHVRGSSLPRKYKAIVVAGCLFLAIAAIVLWFPRPLTSASKTIQIDMPKWEVILILGLPEAPEPHASALTEFFHCHECRLWTDRLWTYYETAVICFDGDNRVVAIQVQSLVGDLHRVKYKDKDGQIIAFSDD